MKLRLAFGHECNRRKVGNLLKTCENVLHNSIESDNPTETEEHYDHEEGDHGEGDHGEGMGHESDGENYDHGEGGGVAGHSSETNLKKKRNFFGTRVTKKKLKVKMKKPVTRPATRPHTKRYTRKIIQFTNTIP